LQIGREPLSKIWGCLSKIRRGNPIQHGLPHESVGSGTWA